MIWVNGRDLRPGDIWRGSLIKSIGGPRIIPAKILVDCVAAKHPDGLPGRTANLVTKNGAHVPCTIFDDEPYQVERTVSDGVQHG